MEGMFKSVLSSPAVRSIVAAVYARRADRSVHPDGEFDSGGRWYPSDLEKHLDSFDGIRRPTRNWPYSYMLRARTKQHCGLLVLAALAGESVPSDVVVPGDVRQVIADALLPKSLRGSDDARALAYAAYVDVVGNSPSFDRARWLVLADYIQEHATEKTAAKWAEKVRVEWVGEEAVTA